MREVLILQWLLNHPLVFVQTMLTGVNAPCEVHHVVAVAIAVEAAVMLLSDEVLSAHSCRGSWLPQLMPLTQMPCFQVKYHVKPKSNHCWNLFNKYVQQELQQVIRVLLHKIGEKQGEGKLGPCFLRKFLHHGNAKIVVSITAHTLLNGNLCVQARRWIENAQANHVGWGCVALMSRMGLLLSNELGSQTLAQMDCACSSTLLNMKQC